MKPSSAQALSRFVHLAIGVIHARRQSFTKWVHDFALQIFKAVAT